MSLHSESQPAIPAAESSASPAGANERPRCERGQRHDHSRAGRSANPDPADRPCHVVGIFCAGAGEQTLRRPEPFESFCLAAAEHDNGWQEWELLPQIDPKTFSPYNFMSIPTEEHIALYQRGIERVVRADHYAGLLVSLHASGLYDRTRATMPGFSAKYVKSSESAAVTDFLQRLRLQQLRLKVDLRADPVTKRFADDNALQANLQRLEALDRLSLYFCLAPLDGSTIDAVPVNGNGTEADWDLQPAGNNFVTVQPYPFAKDPLEISILARRVPRRPYADENEFHKILAQAPYFALNFTLSEDGARIHSRSAVA